MIRTVAVTGATGFIGTHLIQKLSEDGWSIRILARRLPGHPWPADREVETVIGGLDDEGSLRRLVRGCAAVVHAAGLIKARSAAEFNQVNRDGVARLATIAAAEAQPPRFILLSSLAAREPQLSDYGASKHAGERTLTELGEKLSWTILRPPGVYGPGDRETLVFFRAVARGIGPLFGGADNRVSLVHVRDLAAAIAVVLAAPEATAGNTYEVGDPAPNGYTWPEMIEIAGRVLGRRPRLVRVAGPLLAGVAHASRLTAMFSRQPPMLTHGKLREILHPDWVCRDDSLFRATGWRAEIGLEEGFADAIAWYRAEGWL